MSNDTNHIEFIKAGDVKEGMLLDFTPIGRPHDPDDYHEVVSVDFGFWGDGSVSVDIVFKDTNDGQAYSYGEDELMPLVK